MLWTRFRSIRPRGVPIGYTFYEKLSKHFSALVPRKGEFGEIFRKSRTPRFLVKFDQVSSFYSGISEKYKFGLLLRTAKNGAHLRLTIDLTTTGGVKFRSPVSNSISGS